MIENYYKIVEEAISALGLPENFDITKIDSFGLDIVTILTEQINAELKIYNDKGANFEVTFTKA